MAIVGPGSPPARAVESEGHNDDFARLFQGCRGNLLKRCRRIVGDCAEDVVSATYLRAREAFARFDGRNFEAWLTRIAERLCVDDIRHERNRYMAEVNDGSSDRNSEMRSVNALQIRSILQKLPDEQRRCLKLFYIEGYSAKEVARETGFTEKQVKSYLQNGRRNFIREWRAGGS